MAKRTPRFSAPSMTFDRASGIALHRQLYVVLRDGIACGDLREGERLPSSRQLAKALAISRNTVLRAYDELAADGYIVSRVGSGTRIIIASHQARHIGPLQRALAPHAVASSAERASGRLSLRTIFRRSRYPLRRVPFTDRDGNALYLYDAL